VPGIYVHSLFGSRGWPDGVHLTGANRTINREKLERSVLERELADTAGLRFRVLSEIRRLLRARASHPAFDPHASNVVRDIGHANLFVIERSADGRTVRCIHNVSGQNIFLQREDWTDMITGDPFEGHLGPWETQWLIPA